MKKKIIIIALIILVIVICILYIFTKPYNVITMDVNPSIQFNLNKNGIVKRVVALNDDAKDIVKGLKSNTSLEDAVVTVFRKMVENDFIRDDKIIILMHSEKEVDIEEIKHYVGHSSEHVYVEIINIENITKEDEAFARKNNITPAKAAFINTIAEGNVDTPKEILTDKSINELKETEETGRYCDNGYILRGDFCYKEIGREPALSGLVCEIGYFKYNDKCYEEGMIIDTGNLYCREGLELEGEICVKKITEKVKPVYECDKGELMRKGDASPIGSKDKDNYYCVDKTNAKKPTLRCLTNPGHIMIDGKCYNGPAPLINGGCPGKDIVVKGGCYSLDDEDQWVCPNGGIYEKSKGTYVELCPDTFTYITPKTVGYTCDEGYELEDGKCIRRDEEGPMRERVCNSGFTKVNDERCLNFNNVKKLYDGYYCEKESSILEGNTCILNEVVEAKYIR